MKRRSRLTKRENDTAVVKSLGQQSEESLRGNRLQKLERKKESSSETSLLLYKQLNKVIDVLKYEFNSRTEGPTLRANPVTRIAADRDSSVKMADEPKMSLEEEIKIVFEAVELEPDVTQKKQILLEEKKKLSIEKEQHEKELNDLDSEQTKKQQELDAADDDMVREVLQNQLAQVQENRKRVAAEWENLVQALNQVGQAFADLVTSFFVTGTQEGVEEEEETLPQSKSEANEDEDLRDEDATAEKQEVGIAESVVVAPALIDEVTPPAGGPPGPPPPGPPPTPDGKPKATPDESDFPLYDAAVLKELREADERAAKAAKAIEAVREQLAVYAKKDEMTDEDIKMMEEKQKELMAKMEEFEEITKKVQHLVGLVDVASSQLGPPQKPMLPNVGVKQGGPGVSSQPEDTLPKVIVCGTGDIDQVPKIIVCEPTKARDGKHPLYHQIQGKHKDGTSKTAVQDLSNKDIPDQAGGYPGTSGVPNGFPGSPSGYPGSPGGYPSGFPGPSMSGYPGGMGGYPGQPFPGSSGGFGMAGLGMPGFPGAVMHGLGGLPNMGGGLPGMLLPGGMPAPVCGPCQPNKPKKHKSHKKKETCPATCPENCQELEEMLEATLNMSEKLAEQNTELEGSRYELQEAVLNKDKQYDGLALQLESMKMELKNLKNENRYLKNTVAKSAPGHGEAQGDQHRCPCSEKTGMKKTGGLCRKELNTMPMCKAQAYKEMGLPIPRPDNRAPCPGAKFAASMGWNENQGCRNELSKSVNCPDMQGSTSRCVCSTKGPGHCPMHSGRSANPAPQPPNMGSGDIGGANCPCGCLGQAAHCKKADMNGQRPQSHGKRPTVEETTGAKRIRARSSDTRESGSSQDGSVGRRPASDQRSRPNRATQLMASAQEQLKALSRLACNNPTSRSTQKLIQTRSPSRSTSSSSRTPKDILPDKNKFECLEQMTQLLKNSQAKHRVRVQHNQKMNVKPNGTETNRTNLNVPEFKDLKELIRISHEQMKNVNVPPQSSPRTTPCKPSTRTAVKTDMNEDQQFAYIHEILKKSNALTKSVRTPSSPNSEKPATPEIKSKAPSDYIQELAELLNKSKTQLANSGNPKTSKNVGGRDRSQVPRSVLSDANIRHVTEKVTESLQRAGKVPQKLASSARKPAPKEAVVQTMEQEVKSLQKELELVQAERRGLALQKKLLNCMADTGPGGPSSGARSLEDPPAMRQGSNNKPLVLLQKPIPENLSAVELQLNSLREQYRKLQEDYNAKVEEVSMVRVEYEAAKRDALALLEKCREAEARVDDLLERLRIIELEKSKMAGSKDQMMELEQQLTLAKQRYREGQEELEEIRTTMQDQMLQLEEYRNKYLTAQQTVEEQRRQIDIMELENNRISEQVNLEIQRVKTQFQEKLQELTPLPDMLKATQLKLQECDQLRQLAERNVEQLLNQVDDIKDQNKKLESELEELRKNSATQNAEKSNLTSSLTTGEKKIEEIKSENSKLRATVARLEEVALNNDRRLDEKNHEVLQLQTQLETLREESARQVSRTKDRCEAVRRTLQSQISQLETQLAQSRAAARTAQKDRDEIRQRMQAQITSLNDNFEQAQMRIRSLQSHVNYLKSSYTNIFAPEHPIGPKQIDGLST